MERGIAACTLRVRVGSCAKQNRPYSETPRPQALKELPISASLISSLRTGKQGAEAQAAAGQGSRQDARADWPGLGVCGRKDRYAPPLHT